MIQVELGTEGYPKELEVLVEGVDIVGQTTKKKFLRRIPIDPMTGEAEWGMRSYQDEPASDSWGGRMSTMSTRCRRRSPSTVRSTRTGA